MADRSRIEWTDATWNPIRGVKGKWSCVKVSPGCENCYAERLNQRFGGPPYRVGADALRLDENVLAQPLRWKKPRRVFPCSMTDLFEERISNVQIAAIFGVMLLADRHTFQVLTKRPDRMLRWFRWIASNPVHLGQSADAARRFEAGPAASCLAVLGSQISEEGSRGPLFTAAMLAGVEPAPNAPIRNNWPLPNVWLGVSVEDQARADERIPLLLQTPAAVRWVSAEPLLGPVDLHRGGFTLIEPVTSPIGKKYPGLDWVVVGGESGPGARPMDVAWAWRIVKECRAAGVPVFVKQLGANPVHCSKTGTPRGIDLRDPKGGDPSEWPADLPIREWPNGG